MSRRRAGAAVGRALWLLAALLCAACALGPGSAGAEASLGIRSFDGEAFADESGAPATLAGSHPFSVSVEMDFDYHEEEGLCPPTNVCQVPDGQLKDFEARLPAGLVGNPEAVPRCGMAALLAFECPRSSIVGTAELRGNSFLYLPYETPVFNLVPGPDEPARLGYTFLDAPVVMGTSIRSGSDYGITIEGRNFSQALPVVGSRITLWGVPGDSRHDAERGETYEGVVRPFLSLPSACSGPLTTSLLVNSWQAPGEYLEAGFRSHDGLGQPVGIEGCSTLAFGGSLASAAQPGKAAAAAGLKLDLRMQQKDEPDGRASSQLKRATFVLPAGMDVNLAAAAGLEGCTAVEVGLGSGDPARCPSASKIGGATIATPLFSEPLRGAIYVAGPDDNPFGTLLAAYLVAEGSGVILKQPVEVSLDPLTSQVTVSVDNLPRQPFDQLQLDLYGGPNAVLQLPSRCGRYGIRYVLEPWSGGTAVRGESNLDVGEGCGPEAFSPRLEAGSTSAVAGSYSDFVFGLSRQDGEGDIAGFKLTMPAGLTANLARVSICPQAEAAAGTCPAKSRLGGVRIAAGAGAPLWVPGVAEPAAAVYLAGPWHGAPLSLAATVPVRAGPFDLGRVSARAALRIDPRTAQVNVAFDSLPQVLAGVPIDYREIRVRLDRRRFLFNPTDCAARRLRGLATSTEGRSAALSVRFQVGGCRALPFQPRLEVQASGGLARNGHPAIDAVLESGNGSAGVAGISLTLPRGMLLDLRRIRGLCEETIPPSLCPRDSRLGRIRVQSPFLPAPLQGPVNLRTPSHGLPGLLADLRGGRIHLILRGGLATPNGRLRIHFDALPEVPFSRAAIDLAGGRHGIVVNSEDLCRRQRRVETVVRSFSGKTARERTRLRFEGGC